MGSVHKGAQFNQKTSNAIMNYPGPNIRKYPSNPDMHNNPAKKLNESLVAKIPVYKLTLGELVTDE